MIIVVSESAFRFMEEFARRDTKKECGGILVGHFMDRPASLPQGLVPCSCHGRTPARKAADDEYRKHALNKDQTSSKAGQESAGALWIEAAIEARYSDGSRSAVTFTHQSWQYIYQVMEKEYPDKEIVGWFHTHPGFGIFLSSYDLFIHQNFFNRKIQVAYVIDPINDRRGFFRWVDDQVVAYDEFFIAKDEECADGSDGSKLSITYPAQQPIRSGSSEQALANSKPAVSRVARSKYQGIETRPPKPNPAQHPGFGSIQLIIYASAILVLSGCILAFMGNLLWRAPHSYPDRSIPRTESRGSEDPRASSVGRIRAPVPGQLGPRSMGDDRDLLELDYSIRPGDTLWGISLRYYGRGARYGRIVERNSIHTPDIIYPGTIIKIPLDER